MEQWQKWFAWYPVRVPLLYSPSGIAGKYVWGQKIYRRPFSVGDTFYWEYGTILDVIKYGEARYSK